MTICLRYTTCAGWENGIRADCPPSNLCGLFAMNSLCWDTSVFLAWLNEEPNAPLGDIDLLVQRIERVEATLIVPVTIYMEILHAKHKPEQIAAFEEFLRRSNVIKVETTFPIAQKVQEIRSRAIAASRSIKTPDATIIATAIVHKADVLHTLDDRTIALSGSPIVDGLHITLPRDPSGQLALTETPPRKPKVN